MDDSSFVGATADFQPLPSRRPKKPPGLLRRAEFCIGCAYRIYCHNPLYNFEPTYGRHAWKPCGGVSPSGTQMTRRNSTHLAFRFRKLRQSDDACMTCSSVSTLVQSCARPPAGADLIALEVAGKLGSDGGWCCRLRRNGSAKHQSSTGPATGVRFMTTSSPTLRRQAGPHRASPLVGDDEDAYQAANEAIIREAEIIAGAAERMAVIVWEGNSRSNSDATEAFRTLAENAGFSQASF